eukprot:2274318-Heterocapsa_arctica.AAC.1
MGIDGEEEWNEGALDLDYIDLWGPTSTSPCSACCLSLKANIAASAIPFATGKGDRPNRCLLYTSPSPRDA